MFGVEDELHSQVIFYKNLLSKYINYIGEMEGTTFIGNTWSTPNNFTVVEWIELQEIDRKLNES